MAGGLSGVARAVGPGGTAGTEKRRGVSAVATIIAVVAVMIVMVAVATLITSAVLVVTRRGKETPGQETPPDQDEQAARQDSPDA